MTSDKSPLSSRKQADAVGQNISVDKAPLTVPAGATSPDVSPSDNDADLLLKLRQLLDLSPTELDEARMSLIKKRIANGDYLELASDPETIANLLHDLGLDGD